MLASPRLNTVNDLGVLGAKHCAEHMNGHPTSVDIQSPSCNSSGFVLIINQAGPNSDMVCSNSAQSPGDAKTHDPTGASPQACQWQVW